MNTFIRHKAVKDRQYVKKQTNTQRQTEDNTIYIQLYDHTEDTLNQPVTSRAAQILV